MGVPLLILHVLSGLRVTYQMVTIVGLFLLKVADRSAHFFPLELLLKSILYRSPKGTHEQDNSTFLFTSLLCFCSSYSHLLLPSMDNLRKSR